MIRRRPPSHRRAPPTGLAMPARCRRRHRSPALLHAPENPRAPGRAACRRSAHAPWHLTARAPLPTRASQLAHQAAESLRVTGTLCASSETWRCKNDGGLAPRSGGDTHGGGSDHDCISIAPERCRPMRHQLATCQHSRVPSQGPCGDWSRRCEDSCLFTPGTPTPPTLYTRVVGGSRQGVRLACRPAHDKPSTQ